MGFHKQRLRIGVADHTNPRRAFEFWQLGLELGPEIGRFQAVDAPEESFRRTEGCHSGTPGTEVGMIVCPVEKVSGAFALPGYCSKKSAHLCDKLFSGRKCMTFIVVTQIIQRAGPGLRFCRNLFSRPQLQPWSVNRNNRLQHRAARWLSRLSYRAKHAAHNQAQFVISSEVGKSLRSHHSFTRRRNFGSP